MEPVKGIVGNERDYVRGLEDMGDGLVKLKEIKGGILFVEVRTTGYGSNLTMKVEHCDKEIWWQNESIMSIPVVSGQIIRGFYESDNGNSIVLEGYELMDKDGKVLRRGIYKNKGNRFIE